MDVLVEVCCLLNASKQSHTWHCLCAAKSQPRVQQGAVIQEPVLKGSSSFVWSDTLLLLCSLVVV